MFAASDPLITVIVLVVFAIIGAISNWLQRKRQERDESQPRPTRTPPGERRPQSPASSWEEELRRLLQGEEAPAPKPPVVRPAPPPVKPPPVFKPPPVPRTARVPRVEPPPLPGARPVTVRPPVAVSTDAAASARQLERRVEAHLHSGAEAPSVAQAFHKPELARPSLAAKAPAKPRSGAVSLQAARVKAMLQDRSSAQAAVLASVILGAPKAFDR